MKAKCLLAIPLNCKGPVMDSMKEFLSRNYSGFSFEFSPDANVTEPTIESIEAKEGAFGSINGDSNLAAQAQIQGIQDEISFEYRRLVGLPID
jgi:hypothetical protein